MTQTPTSETQTAKPRQSTSDLIVADILRGLYEGRYVAGQRLVEPDLVAAYEVSRSTVREAIKRLAAQGVVEAAHNRGARIRQLSKHEARNNLQITEVIIGLAARLAAAHIDEGENRAQMTEVLDALFAASRQSDKYQFIRARDRFYRAMTRSAKNPELEQMIGNLQVHLVRNRLVMRPEDREASYREIGAAILAGDPAAAEAAARRHVHRMIALLDALYEAPLIADRL